MRRDRIDWIKFLVYRTDYEEYIQEMNSIPKRYLEGTIESMKWFINTGGRTNRFKKNFNNLIEVCQLGLEIKDDN